MRDDGIKKEQPNPRGKKKSLLDRKWFVELFSAGPVIFGGVVAAWKAYEESKNHHIWQILAAASIWLLISSGVKIINAHRQDKKDDDLRSHDGAYCGDARRA